MQLGSRTAIILLLAAGISSRAEAFTLFESALLGPTGIDGGWEISPVQFIGVRFEVYDDVATTIVGGHLFETQFLPLGNHQIFGAIVALSGPADFPNSFDLSTPDVLGTTLLTVPPSSRDVAAPLSVKLVPGWYSLLFGSGLFGATGHGALAAYNIDVGSPSYYWRQYNQYFDHGAGMRFFVEAVPEPSGFSLVAYLVLAGGRWHWRVSGERRSAAVSPTTPSATGIMPVRIRYTATTASKASTFEPRHSALRKSCTRPALSLR